MDSCLFECKAPSALPPQGPCGFEWRVAVWVMIGWAHGPLRGQRYLSQFWITRHGMNKSNMRIPTVHHHPSVPWSLFAQYLLLSPCHEPETEGQEDFLHGCPLVWFECPLRDFWLYLTLVSIIGGSGLFCITHLWTCFVPKLRNDFVSLTP